MDSGKFFSARDQMFRAIDACVRERASTPACMLLLAWIDILVGLEAENGSELTYVRWCNAYMNLGPLGIEGIDLWGARNGLLHSWKPESRASAKGKAQEIGWSWGSEDKSVLEKLAAHVRGKKIAVVSVRELFAAVALATQRYFEEVVADPVRLKQTCDVIEDGWMATVDPKTASYALSLYEHDART